MFRTFSSAWCVPDANYNVLFRLGVLSAEHQRQRLSLVLWVEPERVHQVQPELLQHGVVHKVLLIGMVFDGYVTKCPRRTDPVCAFNHRLDLEII